MTPRGCLMVSPLVSVSGFERWQDTWARHLNLIVPFSTQVYKWVPANVVLGKTPQRTSIPSRGSRNRPTWLVCRLFICSMSSKHKIMCDRGPFAPLITVFLRFLRLLEKIVRYWEIVVVKTREKSLSYKILHFIVCSIWSKEHSYLHGILFISDTCKEIVSASNTKILSRTSQNWHSCKYTMENTANCLV